MTAKVRGSVHRGVLLEMLENTDTEKFWLDDYLKRSKPVRLDNTVSFKTTGHGAQRGSILGPILFNIYVNAMSSLFTTGPLVQYVDTQFLHTGDVEDFNNLVLEAETTPSRDRHFFSLTNGLKLNAKKTECIF